MIRFTSPGHHGFFNNQFMSCDLSQCIYIPYPLKNNKSRNEKSRLEILGPHAFRTKSLLLCKVSGHNLPS